MNPGARIWNPSAPLEQQTILATWVAEDLAGIARISKEAESRLKEETGDPSFDAYVGEKERVRQQVQALYEQLRACKLTYRVEPPGSRVGAQKIRTPEMVLDPNQQHGCCVDLVLLLASLLYHVRIYPLIVVVEGHAILGYWLEYQEEYPLNGHEVLPVPVLTPSQIQQYRDKLAFVECTDFTQPSKDFEQAEKDAASHLQIPSNLRFAVDVHACRRFGHGTIPPDRALAPSDVALLKTVVFSNVKPIFEKLLAKNDVPSVVACVAGLWNEASDDKLKCCWIQGLRLARHEATEAFLKGIIDAGGEPQYIKKKSSEALAALRRERQ